MSSVERGKFGQFGTAVRKTKTDKWIAWATIGPTQANGVLWEPLASPVWFHFADTKEDAMRKLREELQAVAWPST